MTARIHKGSPVRILKHHHTGWTGKVDHFSQPCEFYTVELTRDAAGQRVRRGWMDGPYVRSELEPLSLETTDAPTAR